MRPAKISRFCQVGLLLCFAFFPASAGGQHVHHEEKHSGEPGGREAFDGTIARIETALVAIDQCLAQSRLQDIPQHAEAIQQSAAKLPEHAGSFGQPEQAAVTRMAKQLEEASKEAGEAAMHGFSEEVSARAARMRNVLWTLKSIGAEPVSPSAAAPAPPHHSHAGKLFRIWDLHPALVHFPIAFLLLGVLVDFACRWRPAEFLSRSAACLYALGVASGILTAGAGVAAIFTAPRLADPGAMLWLHPIAALTTMTLFTVIAILRWRRRFQPPSAALLTLSATAAILLLATGWLGADLVYRHGFGVTPESHGEDHQAHPSKDPHEHAP